MDETGNSGKSWLANWLAVHRKAFVVTIGAHKEIAYLYDYQRYVVFDLARDQEERVPYKLLEDFKNGRITSTKYEPELKLFRPAKVVVFSNFQPDQTKLSPDRWQIVNIADHYVPSSQPPME